MEKCLRIHCHESRSWIDIHRRGDASYTWFEVQCEIDIGHGRFAAHNTDIQFLNREAFLRALDRFSTDRSGAPQLDGTYNSFLIFWSPSGSNEVMLSFAVGDAFTLGPCVTEFNLTGSLRLPAGVLEAVIDDFHILLESPTPALASTP